MLKLLQFIKNWTLPVSMGIGAVAYLVFYYVPALEGASQWFAPFFNSILPLFMFLILYVTFCKVDFKKLAPVKWHFWTTACQLLFCSEHCRGYSLFPYRRERVNPLGECVSVHYKSVCSSGCRSNPQTRRQFRADDYLYFPF